MTEFFEYIFATSGRAAAFGAVAGILVAAVFVIVRKVRGK